MAMVVKKLSRRGKRSERTKWWNSGGAVFETSCVILDLPEPNYTARPKKTNWDLRSSLMLSELPPLKRNNS